MGISDAFWVGLFGFLASTMAALLSLRNGKKAERIQELVNGNTAALKAEIVGLKAEIVALKAAALKETP